MKIRSIVCVAAAVSVVFGLATPAGADPAAPAAGIRWSADPLPVPQVANGRLETVSCADPSTCVAVGSVTDAAGRLRPRIDVRDGVSWVPVPSPEPATASDATLHGVSCVNSRFCVAVGESRVAGVRRSLIMTVVGGVWRLSAHPTADGSSLRAVSCASATFCVAVGDMSRSPDGRRAVIEQWDGHRWTQAVAPPTGNAYTALFDVSCPSATLCQAVGTTGSGDTDTTGSSFDLIETLSDGAWTPLQLDGGGGDIETLHGVSCVSDTYCVAAGYDNSYPTGTAYLLTWTGSDWTYHPSSSAGRFDDVSCTTTSFCALTGSSGFVGRFDGTTISADQSPTAAELVGVACVAPATCYAVGSAGRPVVATYSGSWSLMRVAADTGSAVSELDRIDCSASNSCEAVGNYVAGDGTRRALAEHWNGSAWSLAPITNPGGVLDVGFTALSCASASFCVASGVAARAGSSVSLIEMWDGAAWTPVRSVPRVGVVFGVSCASPTFCLALGVEGSVLRWDGVAWTRTTSLAPRAGGIEPAAIDCLSETSCTAVGSGGTQALFEHFDGTAWTLQPSELTTGIAGVNDVDCVSDTSCVAAGNGPTTSSPGYVAVWNGVHWRTAPHRSGPGLTGVSLTATGTCIAVGGSTILHGCPYQLGYDRSASPAGSITRATVRDVSCTSDGTCRSVGIGYLPMGTIAFAESKDD